MKYRIVEERDSTGKIWNYEIQARFAFMWFPIENARDLEYARNTVAKLEGTKHVVHNAGIQPAEELEGITPQGASELKAMLDCPFCGNAGELIDQRGWLDGSGKYGPQCLECGATAESIEKWNMRAI